VSKISHCLPQSPLLKNSHSVLLSLSFLTPPSHMVSLGRRTCRLNPKDKAFAYLLRPDVRAENILNLLEQVPPLLIYLSRLTCRRYFSRSVGLCFTLPQRTVIATCSSSPSPPPPPGPLSLVTSQPIIRSKEPSCSSSPPPLTHSPAHWSP
jgi:hypothetical protein